MTRKYWVIVATPLKKRSESKNLGKNRITLYLYRANLLVNCCSKIIFINSSSDKERETREWALPLHTLTQTQKHIRGTYSTAADLFHISQNRRAYKRAATEQDSSSQRERTGLGYLSCGNRHYSFGSFALACSFRFSLDALALWASALSLSHCDFNGRSEVFIVGTQYSQSGISYGRLSPLLFSAPFSLACSLSIVFVAVFHGFSCCTALGVFQRQTLGFSSWQQLKNRARFRCLLSFLAKRVVLKIIYDRFADAVHFPPCTVKIVYLELFS